MSPITSSHAPTPLEQVLGVGRQRRKITIGLPSPSGERVHLFPLTPEAAGMLVAHGYIVKMEAGASRDIHYPDLRYSAQGVDIVDRPEAMRCDIVLYLSEISTIDARMMRHGALLLTMAASATYDPAALRLLIANRVITLALDLIQDVKHHHPFADILSEISGRAAMALASSLLADAVHGKGILLGGIAGIVPCEVTVIGSGIDACAAAMSAIGLGATVRMFDNDIYRLRRALRHLGPGVSGSALHPRVMVNALRSADVVVSTPLKDRHVISMDVVAEMKSGVVVIDLNRPGERTFPSLPEIDLGSYDSKLKKLAERGRVCYINPGNAVPRTAAMALSNSFTSMITEISTFDGLSNALMLDEGLQAAVLTFLGKPVNSDVAKMLGMRQVDIKLILQFS